MGIYIPKRFFTSFQIASTEKFMYLKIDEVVGGKYIDYSGNGLDADAVTIVSLNDGIKLADDETLKDVILLAGLYSIFYDSLNQPKEVLISHLGYIYNNIMFRNTHYLSLFEEPLYGINLTYHTQDMFGAIDSDAQTIITALGVTSELQKRLVDTHVKDLKAINSIQANFFVYNDLTNSCLKVLYPFVGDAFTNMKYNWMKAIDDDASFRLELADGVAVRAFKNCMFFESTFCLDTNFNANTHLGSENSFSYYSLFYMTDAYINRYIVIAYNENRYEMGCLGVSAGYKGLSFSIRQDNVAHSICENTYQNPSLGVSYQELHASNYYLTNKVGNSDLRQYRNKLQIGSTMNPGASSYYNGNIILGGYSIDGVIQATKHSVLPCGYFHIGNAITNDALEPFQDAVIRLVSSKNYYYYPSEEEEKQ